MPSTSFIRTSAVGAVLTAVLGGNLILFCQESPSQLSPRALFYREQTSGQNHRTNAALPKGHQVVKESGAPKTLNSSTAPGSAPEASTKNGSLAPVETSSAATKNPEVSHLGLRYSLLLVDKTTGDAKAVSSDQVFNQGECFGLEFQSNRSGYLYVFNLGSSGAWKPLLPTSEMPDEANFIPAYTSMRVPSTHCFRVTAPAGDEHLFVVLSRNPQEVNELNRSIRNQNTGETPPSHPAETGGDVMTLASALNQAVQKIANLKSRDLEVQEVGETKNASEPAHAVYVVHTSATPSDKVTTEIKITHR